MRFTQLDDWLKWQQGLNSREIDLGLERVSRVWQRLSDAPFGPAVITVAGTNGKGSTLAFIDAIARAAGYRVGCYSSPHLLRYNERIRLDGEEVDDAILCQAFDRVDQARGDEQLTYFEFGTLAALDIFSRQPLDLVILEVGLGGRLDAVNIIDPDVAVITGIALDHTDWLGDDLEQIGREKAGIMRPGRPVVLGSEQMPASVTARAAEIGAEPHQLGSGFGFQHQEHAWHWHCTQRRRNSLPFPYLRGSYQLQNAASALMAIECLASRFPVDQRAVRIGLQEARLAGRFQVMGREPLVILDVAHNRQAAERLRSDLKDIFCSGRSRALFSMLADKAVAEVVDTLAPVVDDWYIAPIADPRAASLEQLQGVLGDAGVAPKLVHSHATLPEALEALMGEAQPNDRILVFGSFHTVASALQKL